MDSKKLLKQLGVVLGVIIVAILAIVFNSNTDQPITPSNLEDVFSRIGPIDIYPPAWATGEINPDIRQDNIDENICNPDWSTDSIRPPSSYTTKLKIQQLKALGYTDQKTGDYEEDHLISLELGGSPTSTKNLFPEPYHASISDGGARFKDKVENYLHAQVCAGKITLQEAQKKIVQDWYKAFEDAGLK
jgi:hypothetical protein